MWLRNVGGGSLRRSELINQVGVDTSRTPSWVTLVIEVFHESSSNCQSLLSARGVVGQRGNDRLGRCSGERANIAGGRWSASELGDGTLWFDGARDVGRADVRRSRLL
jgi:hypothetical protein